MEFAFNLLGILGWLVAIAGSILVLIEAFKESTTWGFCSLLIPGVILAFVITHPKVSQKGFLINLAGSAVMILAMAGAALFEGY